MVHGLSCVRLRHISPCCSLTEHKVYIIETSDLQGLIHLTLGSVIRERSRRNFAREEHILARDPGLENSTTAWCFIAIANRRVDLVELVHTVGSMGRNAHDDILLWMRVRLHSRTRMLVFCTPWEHISRRTIRVKWHSYAVTEYWYMIARVHAQGWLDS